jgi:hypothetical protein
MARKLRGENCDAIYYALNRGDRREPILRTDREGALFPYTLAETRRKTGWQGEAQKLNPTRSALFVQQFLDYFQRKMHITKKQQQREK